MYFLDSSFLIDYLEGKSYTAEFLTEHQDVPFFATTMSMYEVYVGELAAASPNRSVQNTDGQLDWIESVPLELSDTREAARIYDELRAEGQLINAQDILIGGIARRRGGTVVTADDDFEKVLGLDVELLRSA